MTLTKGTRIAGWVLTALVAAALTMSALMKIALTETGIQQATALGMNTSTFQFIGIIELISVILFVVPRTGVVGTLLLVAYFGGAITVHVLLHQPLVAGIVIEVVVWCTAALRFPELTRRLVKGE